MVSAVVPRLWEGEEIDAVILAIVAAELRAVSVQDYLVSGAWLRKYKGAMVCAIAQYVKPQHQNNTRTHARTHVRIHLKTTRPCCCRPTLVVPPS